MFPYEPAAGDQVIQAMPANGVNGEAISVRTRLNRRVRAWRPTAPLPANVNSHYFCHGYSLGTAAQFGYTIFSGESLLIVLADEYNLVGTFAGGTAPPGIRPQDIMVWWRGTDAVHSARIVNPVYVNGQLSDTATTVNSKTGTGVLRQGVPLRVVRQDYANAAQLQVYRRALGT
jgi:hypothetical protein